MKLVEVCVWKSIDFQTCLAELGGVAWDGRFKKDYQSEIDNTLLKHKTTNLNYSLTSQKKMKKGLIKGTDGKLRCWWPGDKEDYIKYHDTEWGRPVRDDIRLFEKICLEGFQAGLSWYTILKKRENFRKAFKNFDFNKVARFKESHVEKLVLDAGIIRHRKKIESTINNAKRAKELIKEFGSLSEYFWSFKPPASERPKVMNHAAAMKLAKTPTSERLSKDLKKRGWSFVGPTTAYAFMQAMGLVDDHLEGCHCRGKR